MQRKHKNAIVEISLLCEGGMLNETQIDAGAVGAVGLSENNTMISLDGKAGPEIDTSNVPADGQMRVVFGSQGNRDINPGSGMVSVMSGSQNSPRRLDLTHYQYGGTLRQTGDNGHILEMFLGDTGTPQLSLRGHTPGRGAMFQARDAYDVTGLFLSFVDQKRPKVTLEDNAFTPNELSFEHPREDGFLTFRIHKTEIARFLPGGLLLLSELCGIRGDKGFLEFVKADGSYADIKAQKIISNDGVDMTGNNIENVGAVFQGNYTEMSAADEPSAPLSGRLRFWAASDSEGKMRLMVKFATGESQQLVAEA